MACSQKKGCGSAPPATSGDARSSGACCNSYPEPDDTHGAVQDYYGRVLTTSADLKTSACTASGRPHPVIQAALARVPAEVLDKFYGCGAPVPLGIAGLRVLDLGCGSGRDCYVAAALGAASVTGVDMTPAQLAVARRHAGEYAQRQGLAEGALRFVEGRIEDLEGAGVAPASADLVISNCVVNLSPDKPAVLAGAWRALAPGGEMHFSDVYADRRLDEAARADRTLWGECLAGALYLEDFRRLAAAAGFADPRALHAAPIAVRDDALAAAAGGARFASITFRLFKLAPGLLENAPEDYGQTAVYKGSVPGHEDAYALDCGCVFETGRSVRVSGNTAAILSSSWLAPHFEVSGDRSRHLGRFEESGVGWPLGNVSEDAVGAASARPCCS
ncbi:hypothetical protein WJX81_003184 [Elliptochloris bilobata]|uniref:Arsenite methyltransferase n=1 Tax=Elliptochloris bilobata TaxID=381761 RepID=A0AAW1QWW8_9CHLO